MPGRAPVEPGGRPPAAARVVRAEVTHEAISAEELAAQVCHAAAGAVVTFSGVVRDHDQGRGVTGIEYSAHPTAGEVVARIAAQVAAGCGAGAEAEARVTALGLVHRVGELAVGETALAVAVSAPHRAQAFAVCSELVEEVKRQLPVWKRQYFTDGTSQWSNMA
ncbi:molybdenum cofactor biosynthesis protein MoaE [Actinomyces bowdenii]|uniref:Molybdenum cofactor biosynthesis protein MoaE n=1 Tax=Actinomyces bowdenii TaxID=131109 RepID=A0A853EJD8_9ACTO|nr:molybdenum cofactor biosynthesis protein MoaE [Actinomyces bowdenii]MBF0697294.1 molybdenum cofactor biosynthesis protein MoaE [Actinomyces bowdenii]MCR2052342.1 molybdenum cofactor biosynthesis protein MoaE [Actinomyces bowdenii]NYS69467.1 molybdenum cofactor biosynthesis protein MoaE [Actinomyces bowdenii]